jgi:hypothetical protein
MGCTNHGGRGGGVCVVHVCETAWISIEIQSAAFQRVTRCPSACRIPSIPGHHFWAGLVPIPCDNCTTSSITGSCRYCNHLTRIREGHPHQRTSPKRVHEEHSEMIPFETTPQPRKSKATSTFSVRRWFRGGLQAACSHCGFSWRAAGVASGSSAGQ